MAHLAWSAFGERSVSVLHGGRERQRKPGRGKE
jgi:hypothetical protein